MKTKQFVSFAGKGSSIPGVIILLLFLMVTLSSCKKTEDQVRIISFHGNGRILNYSRDLMYLSSRADSTTPGSVLLRKGDLVIFEDNLMYLEDNDPDSCSFVAEEDRLYINGKLRAVAFNSRQSQETLLPSILKEDISSLKTIYFTRKLTEAQARDLKELAGKKSDISIIIDDKEYPDPELMTLFKHEFLSISGKNCSLLKTLSGINSIRTLIINVDTITNEPLPSVPSLREVIITGKEGSNIKNFLSLNRQIEKLSLLMPGTFNMEDLRVFTGLKSFVISSSDTILNQDVLPELKSIEFLGILNEDYNFAEADSRLNNLKGLILSFKTPQKDFDLLIKNNPSLRLVEILENKEIRDLSSLKQLQNLESLIILESLIDTVTIKSLSNLKYLSLPSDYIDSQGVAAGLKKALPTTVIAANEGVCLGSGWLLLLIPLVVLVLGFRTFIRPS